MNPTDFVCKVVQNRRVILELDKQKGLMNVLKNNEKKIILESRDYNDLGGGRVETEISLYEACVLRTELTEEIFKIRKPIVSDEIKRFQLQTFYELGIHPTEEQRTKFECLLEKFLTQLIVA